MVVSIARTYAKEERQKELYDTNLLFKATMLGLSEEHETLESQRLEGFLVFPWK